MSPIISEILKFLYCICISIFGILVFSLLLDGFCFLFLGGWRMDLGKWPIMTGTIRAFTAAGFFYSFCLILGSGGISRAIMGKNNPGFLKEYKKGNPES